MKSLTQTFIRIGQLLPRPDKRDVLVFGGILLIAAGAWMIFPPAALIAAGLLCMRVGLIGVLPARRPER